MNPPKMFISYSWSNPDHEKWVLTLATELRESGVDVILDKWDLKEGNDANAFMEQMVTDKDIKKVALICDRTYAEKTDDRKGGVGTEAQIISPKIYEEQDQNKFVAVVRELDENGKAFLPAYYSSRIYIELSDTSMYAEGFDELLRWAFDEPLHKKPLIGSKPSFLEESSNDLRLPTSIPHRRAVEAIRNGRENAVPLVEDYFEVLTKKLELARVDQDSDPFDEAIFESIKAFQPYRDEAIEILLLLGRYQDGDVATDVIRRFLEGLIPYQFRPQDVTSYREWDYDNFRFIAHEFLLYAMASLLKYEKFDAVRQLVGNGFYLIQSVNHTGDSLVSFFGVSTRHIVICNKEPAVEGQ